VPKTAFYAISILGIVLLQGPEKRSQPTTKSERKVAFQGNNLRPVWCHVPSPTDARAVSNGRSKVHLIVCNCLKSSRAVTFDLTRHRKSQLSSRLDQQGGAMVIDEFFDDQNGFMEEFSVAAAIIDEQANDLLADE